MKEVFRGSGPARVGLYRSMLEAAGIECLVRDESAEQAAVAGIMSAMQPLRASLPTLWVLADEDYPAAMRLLESQPPENPAAASDWTCTQCHESVPSTFDTCWNCENPRPAGGVPEA